MINWQRLLMNLRRKKNLATIAREISVSAAHLNRISRGEVAEPRFNTGLKLLDLHFKYCPDRHGQELFL